MRRLIFIFVTLSLLAAGCNYLDVVPENDIETIETIFEQRTQAETWLETCYVFLTDDVTHLKIDPSRTGADEVVAGDYCLQYLEHDVYYDWNGFSIANGLQMAQSPYGNVWKNDNYYAAIRYCNIFIDNIDKVYNMEDWEKQLWKAEIKALKAHYYFELMRRYGPIILVPQNIDANEETAVMQQPRSPFDECVEATVALLDEAMEVLPLMSQKDMSRWTFHNRESAATLKAMTLLLAASPLFNGNPTYTNFTNKNGEKLFSDTYDPEKWKRAAEAAEEAIQICQQGGKKLLSGSTSYPTKLLNTMADIEASTHGLDFLNDEAIYMLHRGYNLFQSWGPVVLPYVKSTDTEYYSANNNGCVGPSIKMVETYYTDKGLPIEVDKQWAYSTRYQLGKEINNEYRNVVSMNTNTVLGLHLRREPRFYAHIAADRCYWQRGTTITDDMIVKCYYNERYGTRVKYINNSVPQNLSGYYMKKSIYSDITNNLYIFVYSIREEPLIIMRLADLYLMKAEAWNEYEGPLADRTHVYEPLNLIRERAGIPDVETSWIYYSTAPDKVKTKEGMREIIQREWDIEFAFEGRRFWNIRRWLTAAAAMNQKQYGWNIVGETAQQFYNNYEGPIVVWDRHKFIAPRDYLFPIKSEEVLISGCKQNLGW